MSMINQKIGYYTILEKIGRGGMATVYRARDERFAREVAVKMLHSAALDDALTVEKFEQEARLIASLEHHAIVPVYDFGEFEDQPYLVMRLMPGGSLKERLALGPLSLNETAVILHRICSALQKAHNNHIVHRDIKPGNILFDEDGVAFLADFGIARLTDRTQTTTIIGSPHYMAPEQARGKPLSPRTDVYQMGVVLFQMLTGELPFDGETTDSILYQHVHADVPMLMDLRPDLPPRCDGVIGYAMAKDPQERYASARELMEAFEAAIGQKTDTASISRAIWTGDGDEERPQGNDDPTETVDLPPLPDEQETETVNASDAIQYARTEAVPASSQPSQTAVPQGAPTRVAHPPPAEPPPAPPPEVSPPGGRGFSSRWMWVLGSLAVLLTVCALGLVVIGQQILGVDFGVPWEGEGGPVVALPTSPVGTAAPVGAPTTTSPPPAATATLPGEATAEGSGADSGLLLTPDEISALAGGSGRLAYAVELDGQFDIFVVQADNTERRLTTHDDDDLRPIWSPDGERLAYHSLRRTWELFAVREDGIAPLNITNHPADDTFPQWLPDGSRIAFHSNRTDVQFDLFTTDAAGGGVQVLLTTADNEFAPAFSPDGSQVVFHREMTDGRRQVMIMNADGSGVRPLVGGSGDSIFPVWSPDGRLIAFHGDLDDSWRIYTVRPDGSGLQPITPTADPDFYAAWSPNSQWVLYHSAVSSDNRDLFMSRADGSETIRLTNTPRQERMPNLQP